MATPSTAKQQAEDALNRAAQGEPVLLGTAIVNFVAAVMALVAIFGFNITPEQQEAVWMALGSFSILLWSAAPFLRKSVYSPKTHDADVARARYEVTNGR